MRSIVRVWARTRMGMGTYAYASQRVQTNPPLPPSRCRSVRRTKFRGAERAKPRLSVRFQTAYGG
jgi:hypothetical protein